jgi:hypothetical protein
MLKSIVKHSAVLTALVICLFSTAHSAAPSCPDKTHRVQSCDKLTTESTCTSAYIPMTHLHDIVLPDPNGRYGHDKTDCSGSHSTCLKGTTNCYPCDSITYNENYGTFCYWNVSYCMNGVESEHECDMGTH